MIRCRLFATVESALLLRGQSRIRQRTVRVELSDRTRTKTIAQIDPSSYWSSTLVALHNYTHTDTHKKILKRTRKLILPPFRNRPWGGFSQPERLRRAHSPPVPAPPPPPRQELSWFIEIDASSRGVYFVLHVLYLESTVRRLHPRNLPLSPTPSLRFRREKKQ